MDDIADSKVKSLAKAMRLLECFTPEQPEWGITKLAEQLDCSKSNVHNIVSTFCQMGYLTQLPNGQYTLGLHMLEFAYIINQHLGYPKAIHDILVETADKTNQIIYFGLPYGVNVLYLYVVHPVALLNELPYREAMGGITPMCYTGIGKAMLAFMPEEEWESRIPETLTAFTANTITDRRLMMEELTRTRERGYAIDNSERELCVRCVGVPIFNAAGQLVAGMSASGPPRIMTDDMLAHCSQILLSSAEKMKSRIYR